MGVKIEYVREEKPLGTLNAIRLGMEYMDDDTQCVIRNGDVVADLSIKKMVEEGEKSPFDFSIFVTQMTSPYGIVELSGDKIVLFKEKPLLDYYINGGIYFSKGKLDFGSYKTGDIEKTIFPELAKDKRLGYWLNKLKV